MVNGLISYFAVNYHVDPVIRSVVPPIKSYTAPSDTSTRYTPSGSHNSLEIEMLIWVPETTTDSSAIYIVKTTNDPLNIRILPLPF